MRVERLQMSPQQLGDFAPTIRPASDERNHGKGEPEVLHTLEVEGRLNQQGPKKDVDQPASLHLFVSSSLK